MAPAPSSIFQNTPLPQRSNQNNQINSPNNGICSSCTTQEVTSSRDTTTVTFVDSNNQIVNVVLFPGSVTEGVTLSIFEVDKRPSSSLTGVVDISLFFNDVETQPNSQIEICFELESNVEGSCLGFYNTKKQPPVWECEDKCLKKKGKSICGNSDHLTNFAILLTGNDENACDDGNFILNNAKEDGILIACVVAAVWVCLLFLLLLTYTGFGQQFLYGKEGARVKYLRTSSYALSRKE